MSETKDKTFFTKTLEINNLEPQKTFMSEPIKIEICVLKYPPQEESNKTTETNQEKNVFNRTNNHQNESGFKKYVKNDSDYEESLYEGSESYQESFEKSTSNSKQKSIRNRKNKREKLRQINLSRNDDGRGGNCVASNICKTLLRIILNLLTEKGKTYFDNLCKIYEIRSQKENTIILIMILHVMVKKGTISMEIYDEIIKEFFVSLKESEESCERKMVEECERKSFHQKNKKMYTRFAEIDRELYQQSVKNLSENVSFSLKELEEIISETYDRKQREVEKAMGKIKSIILKHEELKEFFAYYEIDIEEAFFESIDYAYRRNLPKRCRQVKERARLIMEKFKRENAVTSENERYMMCYMTLSLIDEKEKEIWEEFVTNLTMKKQFNESEEDLEKFKTFLEKEIPYEFQNFIKNDTVEQKRVRTFLEQDEKMDEETNYKSNHQAALFTIYEELKETFQF